MNRIDSMKSTTIVSGIAVILALVAFALAAQAPEAIATSKWLSLPGFSMPGWLPLVLALTACIAAKLERTKIALMVASIAVALSLATAITALLFVL